MRVVMVGPFGLQVKSTMRERALPMAKALVRRGYTVTLLVPPWDSPQDAGQQWVDEGVQVINSPLPSAKGPLFHLLLTRELARLTLAQTPDVVHFFKPKAYAGLTHFYLSILRRLGRYTGRYTSRYTGRQTLHLVVDEDDWEQAWNEIGDYTPAQKRLFAWQEPWGLRHADAITVASRALERLVESIPVPRYKIYYVPNGFRPLSPDFALWRTIPVWQSQLQAVIPDPEGVSTPSSGQSLLERMPASTGFDNRVRLEYDLYGKPVVLLYTRFFEFRLSFLVDVITTVNQYLPDTRWLVVGEGYHSEEDALKRLVTVRGLTKKFIFAGWVSMETLPYYFAAANAAIYPYEDTLLNQTKCSVKLLDLLSAGVPVVASRVGQNTEYITHGQTGLLVPPQDATRMAEALLLILNQHQLQEHLSHSAIRHV